MNYAPNERNVDETIKERNTKVPEETNLKTIQSANHLHKIKTGHTIAWDNRKLLGKDQNYYRLSVHESIQIAKLEPVTQSNGLLRPSGHLSRYRFIHQTKSQDGSRCIVKASGEFICF